MWFVGAHCDVGGGYAPDASYLSDIGLTWMMSKLASVGVSFATPLPYSPNPHVLGGPIHTPWADPPFNLTKHLPRQVEATDMLHATARDRWNGSAPPLYRPPSMGGPGGVIAAARFDTSVFG